jgi:hypothetical protein
VPARSFPLGDVLSALTGVRLSWTFPDLLTYMTGDSLMVHQTARAVDECRPALLAQHPQLADVEAPEGFPDEAAALRWLSEQADRYGAELPVEPLPRSADHV